MDLVSAARLSLDHRVLLAAGSWEKGGQQRGYACRLKEGEIALHHGITTPALRAAMVSTPASRTTSRTM
jgi:hypothetical protein